jgi:hypothetical protein
LNIYQDPIFRDFANYRLRLKREQQSHMIQARDGMELLRSYMHLLEHYPQNEIELALEQLERAA